MAEDAIRIEGLTKLYGPVAALAGVSLAVQQGEFMALLGPSGCGKTTMLRCIAGFIEPSEGGIWIDGRRMERTPPYRRPVNTVFQSYALFPHLTVAENIAFGPRRQGVDRARIPRLVDEALAMVGMEGFGPRYPSQLSGGQQQRVALARAIVNRPKVLLLDEPLGALDLKLRKRMQLELKHLQEQLGITFIYVTHDQEEALVMADRIAVMSAGAIIQLGGGEEIYRAPTSRFVADFIGEANLLPCRVGPDRHVRLERGDLPLPYAVDEAGSAAATLLVRPESVDLGDGQPEEEPVRLACRLRETVFVGAVIKLYAETDAGQEIVLYPKSVAAAEALAPGTAITVHWPRRLGRVLTR